MKVFFGTVLGMHSETLPYLQNTLVQFAQSGLSSDSSWNQPKPIRHLLNRCNSWPPVYSQCPQLSGSGYSLISQIFQSVSNREGGETAWISSAWFFFWNCHARSFLAYHILNAFQDKVWPLVSSDREQCKVIVQVPITVTHRGPHYLFCNTKEKTSHV